MADDPSQISGTDSFMLILKMRKLRLIKTDQPVSQTETVAPAPSFFWFSIVPSMMLCVWRDGVPCFLPGSALSQSSIKASPLISLSIWRGNQTMEGWGENSTAAWKEILKFAGKFRHHWDGGSSGNKTRINVNWKPIFLKWSFFF